MPTPLAGTELQLNDVVGTGRIAGYQLDGRDVWDTITVKIVKCERLNRGREPMPSDEYVRIMGTCRSASNEWAEDGEKTNEQWRMNFAGSFCNPTFRGFM